MTDVVEKLTEGDIYRWHYRDVKKDGGIYGYHCCSCIGVVERGRLRDTYWGSCSDSRTFDLDDLAKLELERVGNFSELDKAPEYQADYYDDADIVNLNHLNSTRGNFYLRKGAVRSQEKMLQVARENLERSRSNERNAVRRSAELCDVISRIEAGHTDGHIPSVPRSY